MNLDYYLQNGIGWNCSTSELKDLSFLFSQKKDLLLKDLNCLEKSKKDLSNIELDDSALDIVKRHLRDEELVKIKKEINLTVIALRFNNLNEFLSDRLK